MKKFIGSAELLLTAIIWGFAFVAQTAGTNVEPFTFNCLRSLIAAVFLCVVLALVKIIGKKKLITDGKAGLRRHIIGGVLCGAALFVATNVQQYGIYLYPAGAGASGRAGFLTALYVVFVPVVSALLFRRKIHPLIWCGVGISLVGMYLICFGAGIHNVYLGDIVMLASAAAFCAHILVIDSVSGKTNGLVLSCIQFFTVSVLSFIGMLIFDHPSGSEIASSVIPLLYLGIMSSGIAYTLQILGQKNTEPTLASIILSLESVFSVIGGWLILHEHLKPRELIGCALVFSAIIIGQLPGIIAQKSRKNDEKTLDKEEKA